MVASRALSRLTLILTSLALIGGCQIPSEHTGKRRSDGSYERAYSSIESPEYVMPKLIYRYNDFSSLPTTKPIAFGPDLDRDYLDLLKTERFKFTKEEAEEKDGRIYLQTTTIEFDRVPWEWKYQYPTFIRIVTESCGRYWLERYPEIERSVAYIKRSDDKPFGLIDYQTILGANFKKFTAPPARIEKGADYNTQTISSRLESDVRLMAPTSTDKRETPKSLVVMVSDLRYQHRNDSPRATYSAYTDDGRTWEAEALGIVTHYDPKKYSERYWDT